MKYFYKLKKYSEIKFVIEKGEKIVLKSCILYKLNLEKLSETNKESSKFVIAFLLSKKFGNAVKRNRARRLLFASLTENISTIDKKYTYVFIPRIKLLDMKFPSICKELKENTKLLTNQPVVFNN